MTDIQIALAAWGYVHRVTLCRPRWCLSQARCAMWVRHEAERMELRREPPKKKST